jgi:hypothetical protein
MNMSYCRFQNTVNDLRDCVDNLTNTDLSTEEQRARRNLVKLAKQVVEAEENGDIPENNV